MGSIALLLSYSQYAVRAIVTGGQQERRCDFHLRREVKAPPHHPKPSKRTSNAKNKPADEHAISTK